MPPGRGYIGDPAKRKSNRQRRLNRRIGNVKRNRGGGIGKTAAAAGAKAGAIKATSPGAPKFNKAKFEATKKKVFGMK